MSVFTQKFQSQQHRNWVRHVDVQSELSLTFYLRKEFDIKTDSLLCPPAKREYLGFPKNDDEEPSEAMRLMMDFAENKELKVVEEDHVGQKLTLTAKLEQWAHVLDIRFSIHSTARGEEYLDFDGLLNIPDDLQAHILNITGLQKGLQKGQRHKAPLTAGNDHAQKFKGFTPQQIAEAYHYPGEEAAGQCIGLIELGGHFKASDLELYCKTYQIPVPKVTVVGKAPEVAPKMLPLDDLEVTLDVQLAAGLAPKAHIVVYYATSIAEAVHLAVNDAINQPSVLSISWAVSELLCTGAEREHMNELFYEATLKGITVLAASGDHGAYNQMTALNVMLPAANPWVLGCGGTETRLPLDDVEVWNGMNGWASGGGYSQIYPLPHFQLWAVNRYRQEIFPYGPQGRGVPDIAANASPVSAYSLTLNGKIGAVGAGTSAATPVCAALVARLNSILGHRLGWINAHLYELEGTEAFLPVANGNNNFYPAAYGWNACTGLGVPNGTKWLEAFSPPKETKEEQEPKEATIEVKKEAAVKVAAKTKTPARRSPTRKKRAEKATTTGAKPDTDQKTE